MASDPLEDSGHRDTENGLDARQHLGGGPGPGVRVGDARRKAGKALPSVATHLGQGTPRPQHGGTTSGGGSGSRLHTHCQSSWAPHAGQWMSPPAWTASTKPIGAITIEVTSQPPDMA